MVLGQSEKIDILQVRGQILLLLSLFEGSFTFDLVLRDGQLVEPFSSFIGRDLAGIEDRCLSTVSEGTIHVFILGE